jgi:hypothetical protein
VQVGYVDGYLQGGPGASLASRLRGRGRGRAQGRLCGLPGVRVGVGVGVGRPPQDRLRGLPGVPRLALALAALALARRLGRVLQVCAAPEFLDGRTHAVGGEVQTEHYQHKHDHVYNNCVDRNVE